MHACRDCAFYRPFRPLTQLLARDLGLEDKNVLSEIVKMMQDERQKQDGEAKLIPAIRREGKDRWDARPSMSDYCVAEKDVFVVPAIRNQQGDCSTFKEREALAGGTCATCAHCVPPEGRALDEKAMAFWASIAQSNQAFGKDSGSAAKGIDEVRETAGIRKSFEATQTYYAGKLTFQPPRYLPHCRKHSTDTDFLPCVTQNPDNRCPDWAAAPQSPPAPRGGR